MASYFFLQEWGMELKEIIHTLQKALGATAFAALITNNTLENFPDGFKIWFIKTA